MEVEESSVFSIKNLGRNINILYKTADGLIGLELTLHGIKKEEAMNRLRLGREGLKTISESLERLEKPSNKERFRLTEPLVKAYSTENARNFKKAINDSISVIDKLMKGQSAKNEEIESAKRVILGINKRFAVKTQSDHQKLAEILAPFSMRQEATL